MRLLYMGLEIMIYMNDATRYTIHDKRVLLFWLGLLGGGIATANWLIKQGARLTVADAKTRQQLAPSIAKIKGEVEYVLGGTEPSLDGVEILVLNPGVSFRHPLVVKARESGIPVINEATIFYNTFPGKIIGITGTRGKTTTAHWTHHFIKDSVLAGNSPEHPFLSVLPLSPPSPSYRKRGTRGGNIWAVTELSSFHLELFDSSVRPPDIAVVTNIYRDHLNRYDSMQEYAETKKNLYRWQKPGQILITEANEVPLELGNFEEKWGRHNLANVRMAALAAHYAGVSWETIQSLIATLPQLPYRQQVVFQSDTLTIINDNNATSPDGGIAAIERFAGPDTVLIAGGTDANLDFAKWNEIVEKKILKKHRIFLSGSATDKMVSGNIYETLGECIEIALKNNPKIILFSPACKSFEKFINEYDRGEQFN